MSSPRLPIGVSRLAAALAELPGAAAVVLGGSRAVGRGTRASDWDLGLYYRGSERRFTPASVEKLGHRGYVSALGEWGPIVNGGAWLSVGRLRVDVLFRNLDEIDHWRRRAVKGDFDVLVQNGYVVGAPTYLPVGELALCAWIHGQLPRPDFTTELAHSASERWEGRARTSLMFAGVHAGAGDRVCCAGMLVDAILSAAHARLARRKEWVLGEKRLVQRAGFVGASMPLAKLGATPERLGNAVAAVSERIGLKPLTTS